MPYYRIFQLPTSQLYFHFITSETYESRIKIITLHFWKINQESKKFKDISGKALRKSWLGIFCSGL